MSLRTADDARALAPGRPGKSPAPCGVVRWPAAPWTSRLPVSAYLGPELSALRSRAAAANVQRVPGRAPSQAGPAAPPSSRYRDSTASARGSCQSVLRSPAGVQPATLALDARADVAPGRVALSLRSGSAPALRGRAEIGRAHV